MTELVDKVASFVGNFTCNRIIVDYLADTILCHDVAFLVYAALSEVVVIPSVIHVRECPDLGSIKFLSIRKSFISTDLSTITVIADGVVELNIENVLAVVLVHAIKLREIIIDKSKTAAVYYGLAGFDGLGCGLRVFQRFAGHLEVGSRFQRGGCEFVGVSDSVGLRKEVFGFLVVADNLRIHLRQRSFLSVQLGQVSGLVQHERDFSVVTCKLEIEPRTEEVGLA